jgi:hypothetical protein
MKILPVAFALSIAAAACGGSGTTTSTNGPPPGGNPSGVGNYCAKNDDCATKNCYLGPGGGYCTTTCSNEGSTNECPLDTVCKPIQGGARRCLLVCGSSSTCDQATCPKDFCPQGSSCVSVSNTSLKGCEPNPG